MFAIERARVRILETKVEAAREAGETTVYADLLRQLRSSRNKIQQIIQSN